MTPETDEQKFWRLYSKYIDAKQAMEKAEEELDEFIKNSNSY